MAMGPSSLSILCQSVESFVRQGINASVNDIDITVGAPASAAAATPKMNRINLFFNRFEPAGFGGDGHPGEPWFLSLHCLITAFGQDDNAENITAGEFELRMIGEIIRLFHESPVMDTVDVNGERVRLQALFQPLTWEALNQIWSTQSDTSYRPSAAYEFSLGPTVPLSRKPVPKKVSRVGLIVRPDLSLDWNKETLSVMALPALTRRVDISRTDWVPGISFVVDDQAVDALHLELDHIDFNTARLGIWLAGDPAETLDFKWLIWGDEQGWLDLDPLVTGTPQTTEIIPGRIPESLISLDLPVDDSFGGSSTQAQLFAERTYVDPVLKTARTIKSNPLVITFYRSDLP